MRTTQPEIAADEGPSRPIGTERWAFLGGSLALTASGRPPTHRSRANGLRG